MKTIVISFLLLALSCIGEAAPSVSPPQPASNAILPSVVIESVQVDGQAEDLGRLPGPTLSITVPAGPKRVEIHYSATNLTSPDQARFRFRLQGLDKDWVDAGSSRFVMYTMLPAGRYRFEVNVAGPNGAWHEGGSALNITVESPQLWFQVAMAAIFLLAAVGAFYFLGFRSKRNENEPNIVLVKSHMKHAFFLMIPILLCGCSITDYTIHQATQPVRLYRHEKVDRIERAVMTHDGKLVALFDGKVAGTSKRGPFTVTIPLSESKGLSLKFDLHSLSVPRSAVTEGWPALEQPGMLPIPAVSIVLPSHQSAVNQSDRFPGLRGADRALYVVWNEQHDRNLEFVYVLQTPGPKKAFFALETKYEARAHKYPLLLLVPLTIVADVVMSPLYGLIWLSGYRG